MEAWGFMKLKPLPTAWQSDFYVGVAPGWRVGGRQSLLSSVTGLRFIAACSAIELSERAFLVFLDPHSSA